MLYHVVCTRLPRGKHFVEFKLGLTCQHTNILILLQLHRPSHSISFQVKLAHKVYVLL